MGKASPMAPPEFNQAMRTTSTRLSQTRDIMNSGQEYTKRTKKIKQTEQPKKSWWSWVFGRPKNV